ncbi:hypothetical protein MKZ87_19550 [Pseudomonas sp. MCal1]|uniref:EcoRII N-terminal effector-binding domain-containing protein n=1 Tax=Pseudomonas TaxID=286 RepID=UPI001F296E08|nr:MULTISPECIES: EcoRII N-terminal effector-binding domain-containing protein [Pseudomonas]MCX4219844.1 hypothetical protein [Pseudomonas sp. MCal1]UIN55147.1 hypothetical protein LXN51_02080 [Pseudomonas kribbensis]
MTREARKKLSPNDAGKTGTHQAGILVPKKSEILTFFPTLERGTKNPRQTIVMFEEQDNTRWEFCYIHYNNKLFGGTRNEYRLTGMTNYLRSTNANVGDIISFSKNDDLSYKIKIIRSRTSNNDNATCDTLILTSGWTIINCK